MKPSHGSVTRAVLAFAASGFFVLALVGVAGVLVLQRIGSDQAERDAQRIVDVTARGVIQPRLRDGILRGDSDSLIAIETLVNGAVLRDPIVGVRIVTNDGLIVYADDPALIGREATDVPEASSMVLTTAIETPSGTPLTFEAALRPDAVTASARDLWDSFWPVLATALVVLAALQIPLAHRMARKVRQSKQDQERLLHHAIAASELERRRIAADLHDGSVQQLAGLSMSLAARADELSRSDPEAAAELREAASEARRGVRSLRTAVMGISPPDLRRAGLPAALSDLTVPLTSEGLETRVDIQEHLDLPPDVEALLYRASHEAVRNVVAHARARHVQLTVTRTPGGVCLEVKDDGCGFEAVDPSEAGPNGHLGLRLLGELANDAGGSLDVRSEPGDGTSLRLEVPVP